MSRVIFGLLASVVLVGCDEIAIPAGGGGGGFAAIAPAASSGNARREYLVLGSNMSFEECRARGGIIIRDAGSPMIACDPRVRRTPVPANEFDHPGSPVPQTAATAEAASDA